jgi:hypothetical protein
VQQRSHARGLPGLARVPATVRGPLREPGPGKRVMRGPEPGKEPMKRVMRGPELGKEPVKRVLRGPKPGRGLNTVRGPVERPLGEIIRRLLGGGPLKRPPRDAERNPTACSGKRGPKRNSRRESVLAVLRGGTERGYGKVGMLPGLSLGSHRCTDGAGGWLPEEAALWVLCTARGDKGPDFCAGVGLVE